MTGDKKYLDEFQYRLDVLHKLMLPDGSMPEHLDFDKQKAYPEVDGDHGAYMDIPLDYISNALVEHYAESGDQRAKDILFKIAGRIMKDEGRIYDGNQDVDTFRILAWAYEETRDARFLDRAKFYLAPCRRNRWPNGPRTRRNG